MLHLPPQQKCNLPVINSRATFCFGFVLYHPPDCFWNTLSALLNAGYTVFIADNSTNSQLKEYINTEYLEFLTSRTLFPYFNPANLGLSYNINLLIGYASTINSEFLIYLDQDTCLAAHPGNLFTAIPKLSQPLAWYSAIYFSPFKISKENKINICVNSGTAFNVKDFSHYQLIPDFFLEMIDFGIALNLRAKNLDSIVIDSSSILVHDNKDQTTLTNYILRGTSFRVYNIKRLLSIIINSMHILFDSIRFNDFQFFVFLVVYLLKLYITQLIARLALMVDSTLGFIMSKHFNSL